MLILGVISMLFAGIIYAWSVIKSPFVNEFNWEADSLTLNYTLTMCAFCLGGLLGSFLSKRIGVKLSTIISGGVAGVGFILTSLLSSDQLILLYITYALMAGGGIGVVKGGDGEDRYTASVIHPLTNVEGDTYYWAYWLTGYTTPAAYSGMEFYQAQ